MALKSFKTLLAEARQRDSYWAEKAKLDFSLELNRLFKKTGMTQQELAGKIKTSSSYLTKVFRGDTNFTIETMVKLARSVNGELEISITHKQRETSRFDFLNAPQPTSQKGGDEWAKTKRSQNERISNAT